MNTFYPNSHRACEAIDAYRDGKGIMTSDELLERIKEDKLGNLDALELVVKWIHDNHKHVEAMIEAEHLLLICEDERLMTNNFEYAIKWLGY